MLMLVIELGGPFYNFLATPEFSVGKDGAQALSITQNRK